jgi:cobalt-zinc-cadmium efflux system protein
LNAATTVARIESIDGVKDIHHAHLWAVIERDIHFEAHINVSRDMPVSATRLSLI